MPELDPRQIVPRCGGQSQAFEELCCQLARQVTPHGNQFYRLRGAGGDGGVECYSESPDGRKIGWQAKYVFDVGALIYQATGSLATALKIHPELIRYIIAFPFELTGPTGRSGSSQLERLENWRKAQESSAHADGRDLAIEFWSFSEIRALLVANDSSGGMTAYFFGETILTDNWFTQHIHQATETAGPRYTPNLSVETPVSEWFSAFGRTADWNSRLTAYIKDIRIKLAKVEDAIARTHADGIAPKWPNELRSGAEIIARKLVLVLNRTELLNMSKVVDTLETVIEEYHSAINDLAELERSLLSDLEEQHGAGKVDTPGFRQWMAEYNVSFPTSNLDTIREILGLVQDFAAWLRGPSNSLAYSSEFVVSGDAGAGKTHALCDIAIHRLEQRLLTCVLFGHSFRGSPNLFTRIRESLELPPTMSSDQVLDALNAAGEASGFPLIMVIDAINETEPRRYWKENLARLVSEFRQRDWLRLCVSCRTSYLPYCVPAQPELRTLEHRGFAGFERQACQAFFKFYGLEPPIAPILQPELSNPLYLRLVCEAAKSAGYRRLPNGWSGLATAINGFLALKEQSFADEFGHSVSAAIIRGSLRALAREAVSSGEFAIPISRAHSVIVAARPQVASISIVDWLVGENLLIEDAPAIFQDVDDEGVVRIAFERLGDFLIADELLSEVSPEEILSEAKDGQPLHRYLASADNIYGNRGLIIALSILVPERFDGIELPALVEGEDVYELVLETTIEALRWRDPNSFSIATSSVLDEAFGTSHLSQSAMDALLSNCWQPSQIDAIWLDRLLRGRPMARRDAWWCAYLHLAYENDDPARRLIEAAFELPVGEIEESIAERWVIALIWFCAAADLRVRDNATRAAVLLVEKCVLVAPSLVRRFIRINDDVLTERMLLVIYGAFLLTHDRNIGQVARDLLELYHKEPAEYQSATIRDLIRSIAELAQQLGEIDDPELVESPTDRRKTGWQIETIPTDEMKQWENLPKLVHSCVHDDFFTYSMMCLNDWCENFEDRKNMGRWIVERIAKEFGYAGSGCERYDAQMLRTYGPGRGREKWAERIGKKYQWRAMYQLASRLHDNATRKEKSWDPGTLRTPLILAEEREFDPTLPRGARAEVFGTNSNVWWIGGSPDFKKFLGKSHAQWVRTKSDLPNAKKLLRPQEFQEQNWLPLLQYPRWEQSLVDGDKDGPHRHVWMHVCAYLVNAKLLQAAFDESNRRDLFGDWFLGDLTYSYGFMGEYPWGTLFNLYPEEWERSDGLDAELSVPHVPAWNHIPIEWEYDATIGNSFHAPVPAKRFFDGCELWWNGNNGFRDSSGRTLFLLPSLGRDGPQSLMVDATYLLEWLKKMDLGLLWGLIGEKQIHGGSVHETNPMSTFSQVAMLKHDGSIESGRLVSFTV